MIFEHAVFIKPNVPFEREFSYENYAPMFRKTFLLEHTEDAKLYVCGLGYAYYYINGQLVSEDLFTAPVSNYCKTLWYNQYEVSDLLQKGKNTIAVICGNGWYNETILSNWYFNKAPWRDIPKMILRLEVAGETALVTDASWKCKPESAVFFNQLRSGEYFDARRYEPDWMMPEYDDSGWVNAARDVIPPTGVFLPCMCEPIREHTVYPAIQAWKVGEKRFVFDVGQNISGYIRLTASGEAGQEMTIRYAEVVNEQHELVYYGMDHYSPERFQTDRFICSGEKISWSPKFAYHGFRYIEIEGIQDSAEVEVSGVFVHQAVERRSEFTCSDSLLTKMFQAGVMSSWSNMFYVLTDCPTREKMAWTNDAQASAEQMLTNFKTEALFTKWMQDIRDAMLPDGALPGIIPTSGWGYHWGNGPVSDGILFELPYRVYLHTGDASLLTDNLDLFDRYLNYMERLKNQDGLVEYGLDDWAGPGGLHVVERGFINAVLIYSFYRISRLAVALKEEKERTYSLTETLKACKELNKKGDEYLRKAETLKHFIMDRYIDKEGRCTIHQQCSVAMMIYYGLYEKLEPLKMQLLETLQATDFHLKCGMVGLRRLFLALNKCGLAETAYKLLMMKGYPGFQEWFDRDATTLWEKWDVNQNSDSKNHHMYSDFMSWIIKTLVGVGINEEKPGEREFYLKPVFLPEIDWVRGSYKTSCGLITVEWQREEIGIVLKVWKASGVRLIYHGEELPDGESLFQIK